MAPSRSPLLFTVPCYSLLPSLATSSSLVDPPPSHLALRLGHRFVSLSAPLSSLLSPPSYELLLLCSNSSAPPTRSDDARAAFRTSSPRTLSQQENMIFRRIGG